MHSPAAEKVKGSYISRGMLGSVDIAGAREERPLVDDPQAKRKLQPPLKSVSNRSLGEPAGSGCGICGIRSTQQPGEMRGARAIGGLVPFFMTRQNGLSKNKQ